MSEKCISAEICEQRTKTVNKLFAGIFSILGLMVLFIMFCANQSAQSGIKADTAKAKIENHLAAEEVREETWKENFKRLETQLTQIHNDIKARNP